MRKVEKCVACYMAAILIGPFFGKYIISQYDCNKYMTVTGPLLYSKNPQLYDCTFLLFQVSENHTTGRLYFLLVFGYPTKHNRADRLHTRLILATIVSKGTKDHVNSLPKSYQRWWTSKTNKYRVSARPNNKNVDTLPPEHAAARDMSASCGEFLKSPSLRSSAKAVKNPKMKSAKHILTIKTSTVVNFVHCFARSICH